MEKPAGCPAQPSVCACSAAVLHTGPTSSHLSCRLLQNKVWWWWLESPIEPLTPCSCMLAQRAVSCVCSGDGVWLGPGRVTAAAAGDLSRNMRRCCSAADLRPDCSSGRIDPGVGTAATADMWQHGAAPHSQHYTTPASTGNWGLQGSIAAISFVEINGTVQVLRHP